jgi:hypothetical protein
MTSGNLETAWLVHAHLESIERFEKPGEGWFFRFEGGIYLTVESLWRVISATAIAITSEDDGQLYGLQAPLDAAVIGLEVISRHTVTGVDIDATSSDLTIHFGADLRLQIVNDTSGFEAWSLSSPEFLLIGRNGDTVKFPGYSPSKAPG